MRRKNLWLRLSSCTMAALIATTSVVPVSAADVEFQDEVSADAEDVSGGEDTPDAEEVSKVSEPEAEEDVTLATDENTADVAEDLQDPEEAAELTSEDAFSDGEAVVQEAGTDAVSDTVQTGFGTANTNLEKGTYTLKASLMKGNDPTTASMAGTCIAGDATLEVAEDGSATVTVPIQSVTVGNMTGNAEQWKVYKGDTTTETTDVQFTTDENGKVNSITFTVPDKSLDGAYINMYIDLMQMTQDAFLKLDYANAQPVKPAVDTSALEATIAQAEALDEMAYTKASWDGNKDAIEAAKTAAKAALEAKESQEAVDAANAALETAMKKLVAAGDPTDLQALLDQAKALNEMDYTAKTWKYVQDAIGKAETVIANRDTSRSLRSAKSSLSIWMGKLEAKYDTTALEKKIAQAEALKKDDYTAESWKAAALANVINVAKETIDNRGNKDDVHDAIESIENDIQGDIIAQKAKELNDAVAKFQTVATVKSINALKSAVTAAKKLKSADYTESTFKAFTTALTSAEKVLNGTDLSEAQVTAATKSLAAAKTKLVKMKTQTITVSVKNTQNVVSKRYGDKAFYLGAKAKGGLTYKSLNTKIATVDSKGKVTIKAAGTVKITISAKATTTYKAATPKVLTIKIAKKTPSITTKISTKNISCNTLKKKSQVFTLGTSVASKGTLTYKKLSGNAAISVNSKTGKFTVKKGLKKGTYRVKVQIKSAAKGSYNAATKTVTVTVKVK